MIRPMRFGSVCSGIEAASVAWEGLGWTAAWLSEIEPFASAVLTQHWPDTPNLGDMTTLPARILAGEIEAPDIFVGGTPCQSFSMLGARQGITDPRGRLTQTYVEIFDAIDTARAFAGCNPAVCVWENVCGILADRDNAFGNFLAALCGETCALQPSGRRWSNAGVVFGPIREVAWRVLDAQFFGVPQRRRRVFVVASDRTSQIRPAEVLLVEKSVQRDPRSCDEAEQIATANAAARAAYSDRDVIPPTLYAFNFEQGYSTGSPISPCLTKTEDKGKTIVYDADPSSAAPLIRRLMPIECERLQGFPDGHTAIPWKGKPASACPDRPRYRAIGNSMAVPVMRWIGAKICAEIEAIHD